MSRRFVRPVGAGILCRGFRGFGCAFTPGYNRAPLAGRGPWLVLSGIALGVILSSAGRWHFHALSAFRLHAGRVWRLGFGMLLSLERRGLWRVLSGVVFGAGRARWAALGVLAFLVAQIAWPGPLDDKLREGHRAFESGQFVSAHEIWLEGLRQAEEAEDGRARGFFSMYLGMACIRLGEYKDALDRLRQAREDLQQAGETQSVGNSLNHMGVAYGHLGEPNQALRSFGEALSIHRNLGDAKGEAADLGAIAGVCEKQGQYQSALTYYGQALDLHRVGEDELEQARTLRALGRIRRAMGSHSQAIEALNGALAILLRSGTPQAASECLEQIIGVCSTTGDLTGHAEALSKLGTVSLWLGQRLTAVEQCETAARLFRRLGDARGVADAKNRCGYALIRSGEYPQAVVQLRKALQASQDTLTLFPRKPATDSAYWEIPSIQANLATAFAAQGRSAEAFEAAESDRAESLRALAAPLPLDAKRTKGAYAELAAVERLIESKRDLRKAQSLVRPSAETASAIGKLDREIVELGNKRGGLVERLWREDSALASLAAPRPMRLEQLQANLPKDSMLICYAMGEFPEDEKGRMGLWIFTVTATGVRMASVAVSPEELKGMIQLYARLISNPRSDASSLEAVSEKLHGWLVRPIENDLDANTLLIVPWGPMAAIPFGSLAAAGGSALAARKTIVSIPSAGRLLDWATAPRFSRGRLLALAAPKSGGPFRADAIAEANDAASFFSKSNLEIGDAASESLLKKDFKGLGRPDVLHLVCPAWFIEREPKLTYVALTPDRREDGRLELAEIHALDWRGASLVTLSGFSFGAFGVENGGSVLGAAQGFLCAGAPSVLLTLWQGDPRASRSLLHEFYAHCREGLRPAHALRQARHTIRSTPKWSHPFYWSGFVLYGRP